MLKLVIIAIIVCGYVHGKSVGINICMRIIFCFGVVIPPIS